MAFPPPFPNQMFSRMPPNPHGAQQQGGAPPYMGQKFGFFSPQTHPPPPPPMMLPGGIPLVIRPRFNMNYRKVAPEPAFVPPAPVPVTTIFVGSITDKCHDSVIQEILGKCGAVCNWKRLQDSNGKFKAFGFCDFLHPDGARKALRVLKNYPLGDRRLNVKADEQTEKLLEEFAAKRAKASTESVANEEKEDNELRETIKQIIEEQAPEILELTPLEEDELPPAEESASVKQSETGSANGDKDQKAKRKRSRSSSSRRRKRSSSKSKHSKRSRSKKSRRRSSSASSSSSDSSHALSERSRKSKEKSSKHKKRSSRKRSPSSEDSDEVAEKRRLKKEIKQREESYLARLKKWEDREKRRAKQYEKDEEHEAQRQKTIAREAKKLRQFLEDYQDERDDPKYYKGSVLFERRRNYEREREADAKDRHDERKEMEEVKKMILKEKQQQQPPADEEQTTTAASAKREAKEEEEMDSKEATWATVGEGQPKQEGSSNGNVEDMEDGNGNISATTTPRPVPSLPPPPAAEVNAKDSPTPLKKTIAIQPKTIAAPVNGVFQDDEEEEDTLYQIKKKIKPFEITREDRIQSLTPEERKKLIKDLISRIPTEREKLFEFTVSWEYLDEALMEQRVRPWINKKICEYIGEEEPSLVSFICEKITSRTGPGDILQDLSMVLDDEAEVFMVKLWRLIVYESEAKRLGLNVLPSASNSSSK